jgi:hypothetical protein
MQKMRWIATPAWINFTTPLVFTPGFHNGIALIKAAVAGQLAASKRQTC